MFKTCPCCREKWETQEDFISDATLDLNGYKADMKQLECGLFFFTHKKEACFSTMALEARDFLNLFNGRRYPERKKGSPDCHGYCDHIDQLDICDQDCECAFVREIVQVIKTHPKK